MDKTVMLADTTYVKKGLPPFYLISQCATADQREHLQLVDEHFKAVLQELVAYFSGDASPSSQSSDLEQNVLYSERRYYLALYELIYSGWSCLETAIKTDWEVFGQIGAGSLYRSLQSPTRPGDALKLAWELDYEAAMVKALSSGSISVKADLKLLRGILDDSSKAKKSKMWAPGTEGGELLEQGNVFPMWVRQAVAKRTRGKPYLKTSLKEFDKALKARSKTLKRLLRSESVKGQRWKDGQRNSNR